MGKSKEDYYATPDSELGDNTDKVVDQLPDDVDTGDPSPVDPSPDSPAPKGDLSPEDLAKLEGAVVPSDKKPEVKKEETPKATEDYEIEVADDSPLTDDDIQQVVKLAEEKGLTKDQAQEELARREFYLKRGLSAAEVKAQRVLETYAQEVASHPLFATNELKQESMRSVDVALDRFFEPAFKDRFNKYYKDDVYLLTALHRLGKPFVAGTMAGNPIPSIDSVELESGTDKAEEARMRRLYPENFSR